MEILPVPSPIFSKAAKLRCTWAMLNLAHAYQSGDGANANLQVANDYVKQCTNLGNRSCGSYAGNIQGDIDTQQKLGAMQGDVNRWRNCGWVNNYKYSIFNGGMYADKSYRVVDFLIQRMGSATPKRFTSPS